MALLTEGGTLYGVARYKHGTPSGVPKIELPLWHFKSRLRSFCCRPDLNNPPAVVSEIWTFCAKPVPVKAEPYRPAVRRSRISVATALRRYQSVSYIEARDDISGKY